MRGGYGGEAVGSAVEFKVAERECRDGVACFLHQHTALKFSPAFIKCEGGYSVQQRTGCASKMHQCTFCGGEKYVDIVLIERLLDPTIPGRQPGVRDETSVFLRVEIDGGGVFESVLTGIYLGIR